MGEGIGLMDSKDTYRNNEPYENKDAEHGMDYEDKPEGEEYPEGEYSPELPSYEALIEMIGLDNIYAMMESKTSHVNKQDKPLMMDDYER